MLIPNTPLRLNAQSPVDYSKRMQFISQTKSLRYTLLSDLRIPLHLYRLHMLSADEQNAPGKAWSQMEQLINKNVNLLANLNYPKQPQIAVNKHQTTILDSTLKTNRPNSNLLTEHNYPKRPQRLIETIPQRPRQLLSVQLKSMLLSTETNS